MYLRNFGPIRRSQRTTGHGERQTICLVQCSRPINAPKAKESNPACQIQVKRRTDDHPPQITVTFVNGIEQTYDATSTPAQNIRTMILEKGQYLETEQMFREAGEKWPVVIPVEELNQPFLGIKRETSPAIAYPSGGVYRRPWLLPSSSSSRASGEGELDRSRERRGPTESRREKVVIAIADTLCLVLVLGNSDSQEDDPSKGCNS
nr:putative 39S ribosomal L53, mitochondrial [Ipomoea batatas]